MERRDKKMNFVKIVPLITMGVGILCSALNSWASKKTMEESIKKGVEDYLKNNGKA